MPFWREGVALIDMLLPRYRALSVSSGVTVGGCDVYTGVGGSGVLRNEGFSVTTCIASLVTVLRLVASVVARPCYLDVF